ncbi:hypothetical protein QWZ08_01020 [Ferruginibacter paludis]|uniref:hypothetical protein n=1 Tax=Ferruginibacter paludis TaxID=1310417 RepID=UPI0025B368ED|nr:hypothetical protein [Ferruginibacter paludis]MDN3654183.1 hypothetical protein [Ferruginibacter paludis]
MKKILFGLKVAGSVALFLQCVSLEIKQVPGKSPGTFNAQMSKADSTSNLKQEVFNNLINQIKNK